ncbi:hypothetical protein GW17_00021128, partial [Ensete ventricosum]
KESERERERREMHHGSAGRSPSERNRMAAALPLVVALNCLEDPSFEEEALAGTARVEHVGLSALADGRIESAAAVVLHSLSLLPAPAQRRLRPWQLVLCLGSADRAIDSALAADLGLRLVHVDASRAEEVADTVMALFLSLLRRTHLLSRDSSSSASAGWLGSIQPLCRGMRRCRGLVLGIIGTSASARCLASRSLAFKMSVLYFDLHHEVREMPNVLILPRSADYSEEVWIEIREKAITILQSFFLDGIVPDYAVSDEDETIHESAFEDEQAKKQVKEPQQVQDVDQPAGESHLTSGCINQKVSHHLKESHVSGESKNTGSRSEGRHSGSGKKGKKRPARRRSQQNSDDSSAADSASGYTSGQDDDTAIKVCILMLIGNLTRLYLMWFQINRKMEFVFANHSFDVWGSWTLQGSVLEQCKLVNCQNPSAVLEVSIEILAAVDEDGISRWLD